MNQSFANETQIDTFRLNFKNLIKESIQKQLFTAVLKNQKQP